MRLYGVYCKCSHIDVVESRVLGSCTRTPHTLLTCLPRVAVMAVFCCVVLRDVALAEAARTSSRKKVVPLPTAVTCSISLSLLHVDPNSVSGREVSAFYSAPPHSTALRTSREGVRNAVSHSLKWPVASCSLPVLTTGVYF